MQKCVNCNKEFRWATIFKFLMTYKPIHCEGCGAKHSITMGSRLVYIFMTIVPFFVFYLYLSPYGNNVVNLIIGLTILLFGSLLAPFFIKYELSSEDS